MIYWWLIFPISLVLYKNNQIQRSNLHQPVVMPFCIAISASFILRHLQCIHDNYFYYFFVVWPIKMVGIFFLHSSVLGEIITEGVYLGIKTLPCNKVFFLHMYWMDFRGKCFHCTQIPHKFLILCLLEIATFELFYLLSRFLQAGQEGQDLS